MRRPRLGAGRVNGDHLFPGDRAHDQQKYDHDRQRAAGPSPQQRPQRGQRLVHGLRDRRRDRQCQHDDQSRRGSDENPRHGKLRQSPNLRLDDLLVLIERDHGVGGRLGVLDYRQRLARGRTLAISNHQRVLVLLLGIQEFRLSDVQLRRLLQLLGGLLLRRLQNAVGEPDRLIVVFLGLLLGLVVFRAGAVAQVLIVHLQRREGLLVMPVDLPVLFLKFRGDLILKTFVFALGVGELSMAGALRFGRGGLELPLDGRLPPGAPGRQLQQALQRPPLLVAMGLGFGGGFFSVDLGIGRRRRGRGSLRRRFGGNILFGKESQRVVIVENRVHQP